MNYEYGQIYLVVGLLLLISIYATNKEWPSPIWVVIFLIIWPFMLGLAAWRVAREFTANEPKPKPSRKLN